MHFSCRCGHDISNGGDLLSYVGHLRRDDQSEAWSALFLGDLRSIVAAVRAAPTEDAAFDAIDREMTRRADQADEMERDVYECSGCGRLYIDDVAATALLGYRPEHDGWVLINDELPRDRRRARWATRGST